MRNESCESWASASTESRKTTHDHAPTHRSVGFADAQAIDAGPLLPHVSGPADLRRLSRAQLPQVAREIRAFMLHSVSRTGGHLASNLGTVELTIALHYVFTTPEDRLVWDVGHQAYAHKILTGRRDGMAGLRQLGGISGFPRRDESEYDTFGTAHSSTSISAALGMATAARLRGERRRSVAVIGDGALSGGMAFEALNNAGVAGADILVILNDNRMSISPAVGALHRHLAHLSSGDAPRTVFGDLGFDYAGPIDGHDLDSLVPALESLRDAKGPQFLHVLTKKGCGYNRAEADPVGYHGPGAFDPAVGLQAPPTPAEPTFTQVFGQWLCDMAEKDERLVGITPAMREGSGMVAFEQRFPERYHDVGIAEQHAVTFAAGLACEGLKPVLAIYSTFLQRGYDQAIHDVAIQNLPVVFALDRAGVVGTDGATHCGAFDIAYLRCLPNFSVLAPADENECRQMLTTAFEQHHPVAVRYPRGAGVGMAVRPELESLPFGRGEIRRHGRRIAILSFGTLLYPALDAARSLDASVANMRFVKPLDTALVLDLARAHEALVTLEDGCIAGGAGSAVLEALQAARVEMPVLQLGLPDEFVAHGDRASILGGLGLDAAGIERAIVERFAARAAADAGAPRKGRPMEVWLANPRSFCAGVDRAISIVEQALERHGAPVYVYHEIVHNNVVLESLRERGARFVTSLDDVPRGAVLVFNAHGVSQAVVEQAARQQLHVVDATCPLVKKVHREVVAHRRQGREIILVGQRGHAEVVGTLGQVQSGVHLVETIEDVHALSLPDPRRVAWATQTTLSVDEAADAVQAIRQRFPWAAGPRASDVCYASQNRQAAVKGLAGLCDVLIVVGSPQSHNTLRLVDVGRAAGMVAYRVERASQIDPDWLASASGVGVTAGASAPAQIVEEVVAALRALGATSVHEVDGRRETAVFPMPKGMEKRPSSFSATRC